MGRFGFGTRVTMLVFGAIWLCAGALWLWALLPSRVDQPSIDTALDRETWFHLSTFLLVGGLVLLKTAVTRDRPKTFEEEIPDAHPDIEPWDD